MLINLFITFLNMSISGALVSVLLIAWRTFSHRHIPSKFYYILWMVLLFRLTVPFSPKSMFSMLNLIKNSADYSYGNRYIVTMEYLEYSNISDISIIKTDSWLIYIAVIWLIVAVALVATWILFYMSAQRRLRYAVLYKGDVAEQVKKDFGVRKNVNVYVSGNVMSPIVIGFIKPKIVLPKQEQLNDADLKYAIAHEAVHAKRYDQLIKAIYFFVLTLHWYNPLVWISFYLFNEDIETSCDQQVLALYGIEHKERYAYVLIDYANRKNVFQMGYLSFAKNKVAARIEKIMEYKKLTIFKAIAYTAVTLMIGLCVSTNPVLAQGQHYIPDTVYVNNSRRQQIRQYADEFITDIESGDYMAVAQKSTADSEVFEHLYKVFEQQEINLQIDRIYHTSDKTADVHMTVTDNNGAVFPAQTHSVVAQLDTSRIMDGLFVDKLYSFDKYNSIYKIDRSDEAYMLVEKMIKFGLTEGSNTPANAEKIAAFCMDIAHDRAKDDTMVLIPQKAVEDIANEFFLFTDFTNLQSTDYFDSENGVYLYDESMGSYYECEIVSINKTEKEATVTVEFYKDPLHTQVEKIVQYTLKKV